MGSKRVVARALSRGRVSGHSPPQFWHTGAPCPKEETGERWFTLQVRSQRLLSFLQVLFSSV